MAIVLAIGDTHCPGMLPGYLRFLRKTADKFGATRVVHIGDLVDWATINYHEKNPSLFATTEEFKEAMKQVKALNRAFPKADWMLGNHDVLPDRKAVTAGLPSYVLKTHNDLWQTDWSVHQRFDSLMIDGVLYNHGEKAPGGKTPALDFAQISFCSVVIGHYHSRAGAPWGANDFAGYFGLSTGCGVDHKKLQFEYGRKMPKKPLIGCGIIEHGKQATFVRMCL